MRQCEPRGAGLGRVGSTGSAASIGAAQWSGTRAAGSPPASSGRGERRRASESGSVLSLQRLLQDVLVEGEVGDELLQTRVLGLQILQSLELIAVHRAVLPLPAVVGVLGHADAADRLGDCLAFGTSGFDLAELGDDLVECEMVGLGWVGAPDLNLLAQFSRSTSRRQSENGSEASWSR